MERKINIHAYAENVPEDINNLQTFAQEGIDHIVADAITAAPRYIGFAATKSGLTSVVITAGRLYKDGKRYALNDATTFDFMSNLPVAAKKSVIVSLWGTEVDDGPDERAVLVAATATEENPVYHTEVLAMTHSRVANIGRSIGAEAPDPIDPVVDVTLVKLCRIILTTTGVDSIEMFAESALPNLVDHESRIGEIEEWEAAAAPKILSLESDVARLSQQARGGELDGLVSRLAARVAINEALLGVPSDAADSRADYFLEPATSDLARAGSACKIMEGVRFPDAAANAQALQLLNPLNPDVIVKNGLLLPRYTGARRISTGTRDSSTPLSSYTYSTSTLVQKTVSRRRVRYGAAFRVCTNRDFWKSGAYDPITQIFKLPNGETFKAAIDTTQPAWADLSKNHLIMRVQQFWEDTVTEPYWDRVTTTSSITGAGCYESWTVGQDFWLRSIDIPITALDADGSITLLSTGCLSTGESDLSAVLGQVTVARGSLKLAPDKTSFLFPRPIYLEAGKRNALRPISAANHSIATTPGTSFAEGMFFGSVAGVDIPDPSKHICMFVNACEFEQTVTYVDLAPLSLVGGIADIDILASTVLPASTTLTYQVQIAGVWMPLTADTVGQLTAGGSLPVLLPFRAVFSGSKYIQPAIDLLASLVKVSRAALSYTHFWPAAARTPPAATTKIRARYRYEHWDAAHHAAVVKLLTGASYTTETAASSYSDVLTSDGALERTYVWNLGAAVTSYKLKATGTTNTPLILHHIANLVDWVL
ncbi:hypothetical protein [Methylosinus sp. Sm6]|uniref:hypothetical protein n=1 Tax=Methylosinus sp. Sm6 TaxID=2866948 RepID=UPI001C9A12D7|nr:hypothetical protein [Methylosinus sp. Sm6]MBY6244038.1 hypothetical protein [Methylosinus sp. Sm6]